MGDGLSRDTRQSGASKMIQRGAFVVRRRPRIASGDGSGPITCLMTTYERCLSPSTNSRAVTSRSFPLRMIAQSAAWRATGFEQRHNGARVVLSKCLLYIRTSLSFKRNANSLGCTTHCSIQRKQFCVM